MYKSYKYRLYPTDQQKVLLNKHIGACRFVYNLALEVKSYAYATQRRNVSGFDLIKQLLELKRECPWLKEVCSQALQQSIINLDNAFQQFFKGKSAYPCFKNKSKGKSFRNPHGKMVEIEKGKIRYPRFQEGIKIVVDRPIIGVIKSTTISKSPANKYYVSILCEVEDRKLDRKPIQEETAVGIDLGLIDFITTSDGKRVSNPRHLKKSLSKLKYLNRQLSRKKLNSNNRKKSKRRLSLHHDKITNQRKDFIHKLSSNLVKNHDTLCFESLRIENMVKNRSLAQSIQSAGWRMFVDICMYKAEWNGKSVLQISKFQASTKLCSTCGGSVNSLKMSDRAWTCENCHSEHDRDVNAAINIKNISLKNCGGVRRGKPVELPILVGAMKQESNLKECQTSNRRIVK